MGGYLPLVLLILAVHSAAGLWGPGKPAEERSGREVFVQIRGDVPVPGIYGFPAEPHLSGLITRAGGNVRGLIIGPALSETRCRNGERVTLLIEQGTVRIMRGQMSAFHRITCGIPVCINRESREGFTAVPGIGSRIAESIVRERSRRGGFKRLEELMCVQGVGPGLYKRIFPYLGL
jgi:competence protein ComEA